MIKYSFSMVALPVEGNGLSGIIHASTILDNKNNGAKLVGLQSPILISDDLSSVEFGSFVFYGDSDLITQYLNNKSRELLAIQDDIINHRQIDLEERRYFSKKMNFWMDIQDYPEIDRKHARSHEYLYDAASIALSYVSDLEEVERFTGDVRNRLFSRALNPYCHEFTRHTLEAGYLLQASVKNIKLMSGDVFNLLPVDGIKIIHNPQLNSNSPYFPNV